MGSQYSVEDLYDRGDIRSFDREASAVAFPLGGIGTGNISLGVRGQLRDWEIFNQPNKGVDLPYSFFAVRCSRSGESPVTRVLEGKHTKPYTHWYGMPPTTTAGLPRLDDVTFTGEYPIAEVDFHDGDLPVQVSLESYTPFIPLDPEDSGIPCAVLEYTFENPTPDSIDVSVVGSLSNPVGYLGGEQIGPLLEHPDLGGNRNTLRQEDGLDGIHYTSEAVDRDDQRYGELSLSLLGADDAELTHKTAWSREDWWNNFRRFWDDFRDDGRLEPNSYEEASPDGNSDVGSLGAVFELAPGESRTLTYLLTWYFPTRPYRWDDVFGDSDQTDCCGDDTCSGDTETVQNHYATRFDGAWDIATYVTDEFDRLRDRTYTFRDAFFDSTVPTHVLDAVSSQISVARSTTCMWFADGSFYGYEGCAEQQGCCAGTCTHVWNYAQSLARLFPSLEREMRRIDYSERIEDNGFMHFRTGLPPGEPLVHNDRHNRPAADGQMGTVMRVYREWIYSGDTEFLEELWPQVKSSIEFAFEQWDPDEDGVMTEPQHNTYDIEFHGPNTMTGTWYLGALRAGAEMARAVDDDDAADRYEDVFQRGRERLDEACWNGEYYQQALSDPDKYRDQYGTGCLIDQLVGQWNAEMVGLGELLPEERVRSSLQALFEHNFLEDFSAHHNTSRTYALNDDAGLLMCTWPRDGQPEVPFPYSEEVMSGFAYQVAAHMIYEGFVDEGLTLVKAIRDRHDGVRRNPWNEFECGNHYARTMASWSVYEALCGYEFDLTGRDEEVNDHGFRVDPAIDVDEFQCFWVTGDEWGTYNWSSTEDEQETDTTVLYEG